MCRPAHKTHKSCWQTQDGNPFSRRKYWTTKRHSKRSDKHLDHMTLTALLPLDVSLDFCHTEALMSKRMHLQKKWGDFSALFDKLFSFLRLEAKRKKWIKVQWNTFFLKYSSLNCSLPSILFTHLHFLIYWHRFIPLKILEVLGHLSL